ncbi:uncharacterized protein LOC103031905 isoform X3 [Astyanax mexicanus]|uniref:uncharacterized protein LOC103031905 isoform X3 n=1 Tax=Astyanax mexicanus TaxID=7994 RepID=UPI0020CB316C|nr:uncharacterized protein LOC103031905 isoform X3 [Astyanax mexicanus]
MKRRKKEKMDKQQKEKMDKQQKEKMDKQQKEKMDKQQKEKSAANRTEVDERPTDEGKSSSSEIKRSRSLPRLINFFGVPPDVQMKES